jgi:hypothetical protein
LLDLAPESEASFLLLADPATLDAESCSRGLDRAFPGSTVPALLRRGEHVRSSEITPVRRVRGRGSHLTLSRVCRKQPLGPVKPRRAPFDAEIAGTAPL